ncbi:MAG: hypothetical protein SGJ20_16850 [Planctomycetota bacterium]|nr:hypothetical protein [Planctomycetota bacterium]
MTDRAETLPDIVAASCSAACDDLQVQRITTSAGVQIDSIDTSCTAAGELLGLPPRAIPCRIDGKEVSQTDAIAAALKLLKSSQAPLIYGLRYSTAEAQGVAVSLGERLGATIDTAASNHIGARGTAIQTVGTSGCTYGELRDRADCILFWQADPAATHDCFWRRFVEGGANQSSAVRLAVGSGESSIAEAADLFVPLASENSYAALSVLRALLNGATLDPQSVFKSTNMPLSSWQKLLARLKESQYGVVLYDPSALSPHVATVLHALTIDLCAHTRFSSLSLPKAGNLAGASAVLTWRTGFPGAVNFATGYPRYSPCEWSAQQLIARGEADLLVLIGDDLSGLGPVAEQASRLPRIEIGVPTSSINPENTPAYSTANLIQIPTASYLTGTDGTVFRGDGVPLPLRAIQSSPFPDLQSILQELLDGLAEKEQR